MTQTIKSCNEIPVGKTYPVEHLRTATDLETLCALVDAGHPIAAHDGCEARLLRVEYGTFFNVDHWSKSAKCWISSGLDAHFLLDRIKLAPLAYRNGRPLHVGDLIQVLEFVSTGGVAYFKTYVSMDIFDMYIDKNDSWRFADEAEAV
jgi:hypothetical protein